MDAAWRDLGGSQSVLDLISRVGRLLGKPITLRRHSGDEWESLTAVAVVRDDRVDLHVRTDISEVYKNHCICHELAHLLQGGNCGALSPSRDRLGQFGIAHRSARAIYTRDGRVLDVGDPDTVALVEREAESLAFKLGDLVARNQVSDLDLALG